MGDEVIIDLSQIYNHKLNKKDIQVNRNLNTCAKGYSILSSGYCEKCDINECDKCQETTTSGGNTIQGSGSLPQNVIPFGTSLSITVNSETGWICIGVIVSSNPTGSYGSAVCFCSDAAIINPYGTYTGTSPRTSWIGKTFNLYFQGSYLSVSGDVTMQFDGINTSLEYRLFYQTSGESSATLSGFSGYTQVTQNCIQCLGDQYASYKRTLPNCICPSIGYYSNLAIQDDCIQCPFEGCYTCTNGSSCSQCKGDSGYSYSRGYNTSSGVYDCSCPYKFYSNISLQVNCIACGFQTCLTCTDNTQCLVCIGDQGYAYSRISNPLTGLNECICPVGYYSNLSQSDNCILCEFDGCLSCDNSLDCIQCIGDPDQIYSRIINPLNNKNECICPDGYYSDITIQENCLLCSDNFEGCLTCDNSTECIKCIGDESQVYSRIINPVNGKNECICPNKFYSDLTVQDNCLQCSFDTCLTCINNQECVVCIGDLNQLHSRISNTDTGFNECICPIGYYSDLTVQDNCIKCEFQCYTCEISVANCTQCVEGRFMENFICKCPKGFYDDGIDLTCLNCDPTCAHCDKDQCFECYLNKYNHNPGVDLVCDCNGPNYLDHTGITEYCTTCDTVVLKSVLFSQDYFFINIEFYDEIIIRNRLYDVYSQTKEFCIDLFQIEILNKLGESSFCQLDISQKIIIIQLGLNPTILFDELLLFNQNLIQRVVCLETEFINEFLFNEIKLHEESVKPFVNFNKLGDILSLCSDIYININQIQNDGNRGLFNFFWNIQSTSSTNTIKIDDLLVKVNENKLDYLLIPALTLETGSDYVFNVQYENFATQQNSTTFEFSTLNEKRGLTAQVIQTRPFLFKNFKQNIIEASFQFLDCSGGFFTQVEKSLDITWIDETDINNPINKFNQLTEPDQQIQKYTLEKYTQKPGKLYNYKINIKVPGETIEQNIYFVYQMFQSELVAVIEGGNQMQPYTKKMKVIGKGYDPDELEENQTVGIINEWQCTDMNKAQPCQSIIGDTIIFDDTNIVEFQEKLFKPYSSLQFVYKISKDGREPKQDQATIVIVETDLPELEVLAPEAFQTQKINQNDDIQITIITEADPDEVFFSVVFLYKLDVVATKSFEYNIMAFKIWDIYNEFSTDEKQLQIRVSVYDPKYFMPSESNFNIELNFEPQQGTLQITPLQGISMETEFNFLLEGFRDEDLPLSYKYQYYLSQNDYLKEVNNGVKQIKYLKNILSDFTNINTFTTKLPQGQLNQENQLYELFIMVSVSDSLGAVKNVTQIIEVQPSLQDFEQVLDQYQQELDNLQNLQTEIQINYLNILATQMNSLGIKNCQNNCSDNGECKISNKIKKCECVDDFYLSDCSQNVGQEKYSKILKQIYDQLQLNVDKTNSQAIKDQILKSITKILDNDEFSQAIETSDLQDNFDKQNKILEEQGQALDSLINSGQLNQADNLVSTQYQQVTELISKSLENIDSSFKTINNLKLRRRLSQEEEKNLQQQMVDIGKSTSQMLQSAILPNSEPLEYDGTQMKLKAQKLTNKKMESLFFQTESNIIESSFNNDIEEKQIIDGELTNDGEQIYQQNIFKTSQYNYKDNPYLSEGTFPYPQQNTPVNDLDLQKSENQANQDEIQIKKPLNIRFASIKDSKNQKCITKSKQNQEWSNEFCETQEKENSQGEIQINCKCSSLEPATVIDDINNLFENSLVNSVYSDEGLTQLASFKFWESVMFYIILIKTIILALSIVYGYKLDKKEKLKKQKEDQEKQEQEQIEKEEKEKNAQNLLILPKDQDIEKQDQNKQDDIDSNKDNIQDQNMVIEKQSIFENNQQQKVLKQSSLLQQSSDNRLRRRRSTNSQFKLFMKSKYEENQDQNQLSIRNQNNLFNQQIQENLNEDQKEQENTKKDENSQNNNEQNQDIILSDNTDRPLKKRASRISKFFKQYTFQTSQDINNLGQQQINNEQNQSNKSIQQQEQKENTNNDLNQNDKVLSINTENNMETQEQLKSNYSQKQFFVQNQNSEVENQQESQKIEKEEEEENNKNESDQQGLFKEPVPEEKLNSVSEGIIKFHEFFSIFYITDEKISRPVRFSIYYLKITFMMAVSGLFSQNTTQVQSIYLSIISAILLVIPLQIIQAMYKSKFIIMKGFSIILLILIQLFIIYTLLVTAAVMGIQESNAWVLSYIYTFVTDFFIIIPIQISLVLNIIKFAIVRGKKLKFINVKTQAKMIKFIYPGN